MLVKKNYWLVIKKINGELGQSSQVLKLSLYYRVRFKLNF